MLRSARNYIAFLLAVALFAACSRIPENTRYIPADAVAIVGINISSLGKKIAWNLITGSKLFKEIKKRMPADNAGAALGGIENAGFDVSNTFFVYTKPDTRFENGIYTVGLLPLDDAGQWEQYMTRVFTGVVTTQRNGRKEARLGTGMYVAWTPELLIVVNAVLLTEDEEGNITANESADMLPLQAEVDRAFMVPTANPINALDRFNKFAKKGYDLAFWINYGKLVNNYSDLMQLSINGVSLATGDWKDAILTAGFNFTKGKIAGDVRYYLPAMVAEVTKEFGEVVADKEMLDRLPKSELDLLMSMHISPKGVKALLEKAGLFGLTNVGLTTQGLDVDYVLDAFSGDMAILISDFSLGAEMVSDPFMGQMVTHKKQKAAMSVTCVVKAANVANFNRLLEMTTADQMIKTSNGYILPLSTRDSVHLVQQGKFAVISNNRNYAYGFYDGRFKNEQLPDLVSEKVYDRPFAFFLNIRKLFRNVDPAVSTSPRDSAMIAESKKLLDNVVLQGGKFVDDAYKFSMEVNFINKDENSILELLDFGMKMNDIDSLMSR